MSAGKAPGGFARRDCATCGEKDVAHIKSGRPVKSHRRGRAHQAALAAVRKKEQSR